MSPTLGTAVEDEPPGYHLAVVTKDEGPFPKNVSIVLAYDGVNNFITTDKFFILYTHEQLN